MASLNSSLNNLRGRSSDGRGSMPNLHSSGATSRGAMNSLGNSKKNLKSMLDD